MHERTCSFDGCDRRHLAKGWCKSHYKQAARGRELKPLRPSPRKHCTFQDCGRDSEAKGYCSAHYKQLAAGIRLTAVRDSTLTPAERYWQNVTKTDGCWTWTGSRDDRGYGKFYADGFEHRAHRYGLKLAGIEVPASKVVDHLCHTLSCVRPDHLRVVTQQENSHNIEGLLANNTSGYRGVSRNGTGWVARVRLDGTLHTLGTYPTAAEAGRVAADYRTQHMGLWDSTAQTEWREVVPA
ncbi:HNH endonuclease [Brachybacterium muris]|uniref:HNH endonuclease signature motif containing protein n=1 Tax=Brachybacterium muris TaxID=219301 RepID=UPI00223ADB94|nr:HNH endonuclease signature motif containing protein [Brachybacterium muris]MCT2177431.1 HNH endonuclease [Brachybacterium muris]